MQSGDSDGQLAAGAGSPSSTVPGVPWWGGVCLPAVHASVTPEKEAPVQNLTEAASSGYEKTGGGDETTAQQNPSMSSIPPPPGEYIIPRTHLEMEHSVVQAAYPYADPYFGGIMTAYGAQGMVQPHILGLQQARMPLPSEMMEEEPVYVNAKQYHGILRRRQSRAKAESENRLIKTRKPYLHESRHRHALRRARGCGGRFLNTKAKDKEQTSDGNRSESGTADNGGGLGGGNGYHVMFSHGRQQDQMFHSSAFHPIPGDGEGVQAVVAMQ